MNTSLLSDLDIARIESPNLDDATLVRQLADATIRELELRAPVDPSFVASYRGISRIEEADQPWAGLLTHGRDGTVARVRASDSRRRKRFTAFHEVEHTYLPGFSMTQFRCDPAPNAPRQVRLPLEALADIGASELLFPRSEFREDLDGNRVSMPLVEDLADRYDASLLASALRACSLAVRDTLLICAELGVKPSEPEGEPVLRIRWSSTNGNWPFIPRAKSVPDNSPIARALQGEVVDEIGDLIGICLQPLEKLYLSAAPYPYRDQHGELRHRVLCLATRN